MAICWVHLPSPVGYVMWVLCKGPFHLQVLFSVVCGFLLWLHRSEGFRLSSVRGYRLMSAAFHFCLPVISFHPVLRTLLHSFRVSSPSWAVRPPSWALAVFLCHLPSSSFASLRLTPLRSLVKMVLFFVALAAAVPLGELRALSRCFSFVRVDACLSFVHTFVAKCESLLVPSLLGYLAVRLCGWSRRLSFAVPCSCPLHFPGQDGFRAVSPLPSFCLSVLLVSGFFCDRGFVPPPGGVPAASAARLAVSPVRTHGFRGLSTSCLPRSWLFLMFSSFYVSFVSLFYACPSLKRPMGLCYMDICSVGCLGFLRNSSSHFPGLCRFVLTCNHSSLFLWYPAIDIVWRGPVFLALGFLRHLALRGSALWSPSLGWCSIQSFSQTSVVPFLILTHTLTVTILLLWFRL